MLSSDRCSQIFVSVTGIAIMTIVAYWPHGRGGRTSRCRSRRPRRRDPDLTRRRQAAPRVSTAPWWRYPFACRPGGHNRQRTETSVSCRIRLSIPVSQLHHGIARSDNQFAPTLSEVVISTGMPVGASDLLQTIQHRIGSRTVCTRAVPSTWTIAGSGRAIWRTFGDQQTASPPRR